MENAKHMMEKMGWDPSKGLGKNEQGITKPIRLNYQQTKKGLGFSKVEYEPWWEKVFDEAAGRVKQHIAKQYPHFNRNRTKSNSSISSNSETEVVCKKVERKKKNSKPNDQKKLKSSLKTVAKKVKFKKKKTTLKEVKLKSSLKMNSKVNENVQKIVPVSKKNHKQNVKKRKIRKGVNSENVDLINTKKIKRRK